MKDDSEKLYKLVIGILAVLGIIVSYLLIKIYLIQHPATELTTIVPENLSLLPIFLTGLLTGGLTCLAVQGGLLASTIAMQEEGRLTEKSKKMGNAVPILAFLGAKLIAYTFLGLLLGWFGSLFQLSLTAQVIMQFAVIIFMIGTAGNILEIHPVFRYFAIQPPKFLTKIIKNQSRSNSIFAPAFLGALTIFIPCGTTQAMMALAIGSGKPLLGAAIMFTFILGTTPLFFILGFFATKLGDRYQKKFMKFAAIALILLAIFNFKNALGLTGINFDHAVNAQGPVVENPTIEFTSNGYVPGSVSVHKGSQVTLTLKNTTGGGCIQSFVIPKLNVQKIVREGTTEAITFTAPAATGPIPFMCGMGMFRGVINVI